MGQGFTDTTHLVACWAGGRFVAALCGLAPALTGDLPPQDVTMLGGGDVAGSAFICGFTTALGRLAVSHRFRGLSDLLRGVLRQLCAAVSHWSDGNTGFLIRAGFHSHLYFHNLEQDNNLINFQSHKAKRPFQEES